MRWPCSLQFQNDGVNMDSEMNIFIPDDLNEYHISGGAIASSSMDIRLILFSHELEKNTNIEDSGVINLVKTAKTEIIMHPNVAKQIRDLLDKELEKFDKK